MDETVHAALGGWGDFYLITGTAAAALTGLQFVVQTLLAGEPRSVSQDPEAGTAAFGTPTVVHFAAALVLSALLAVPWPSFAALRTALVVVGSAALVYSAVVLRRARRQRIYVPVLEDWVFHVVLPSAAYASVLIGGLLVGDGRWGACFAIAMATLLLVCVGVHNAWDTVTYLTIHAMRGPRDEPPAPRRDPPPTRRRRRR